MLKNVSKQSTAKFVYVLKGASYIVKKANNEQNPS